jgi:hypothetical protein
MLISMMTGALGESQLLLEDHLGFQIFLNF